MATVVPNGVPATGVLAAAQRFGGGIVTGAAGGLADLRSRWWMKRGPMSANTNPRGIAMSHGTMAASAQRFDTPARYTVEQRSSMRGDGAVTSGDAACATLQSSGMAGTPKPPKGTRRRAKGDEVINLGAGLAWRQALVWARETRALLANPSAQLPVANLRRLRRRYARSLALAKATPMPGGERVRRELTETVAAIDDSLVTCLRRR